MTDMKQYDKQLLIQALSSLLPYEVMLSTPNGNKPLLALVSSKEYDTIIAYIDYHGNENDIDEWEGGDVEFVKPYLRPLSSMTDEEKIHLYKLAGFYYLSNYELEKDEWYRFTDNIEDNKLFFPYPILSDDLQKVYKYLNENCYDYWGLIDKGLAVAVTKENNPYVSKEELE